MAYFFWKIPYTYKLNYFLCWNKLTITYVWKWRKYLDTSHGGEAQIFCCPLLTKWDVGCPANTNYTNKHERITNNYSFVFVRLYSRTRRINSPVCSSFLSSNKHEQTSNYNMLRFFWTTFIVNIIHTLAPFFHKMNWDRLGMPQLDRHSYVAIGTISPP